MARNTKAIIGLARGRVAFFEPLSNLMLDLSNPVGYVYEGTNTSGLKSALGGAIYIISGSLEDKVVENTIKEVKAPEVKEEVKESVKEPVEEKVEVVAEPVEEKVEETKASETSEEVHHTEHKKTTRTRKKAVEEKTE